GHVVERTDLRLVVAVDLGGVRRACGDAVADVGHGGGSVPPGLGDRHRSSSFMLGEPASTMRRSAARVVGPASIAPSASRGVLTSGASADIHPEMYATTISRPMPTG